MPDYCLDTSGLSKPLGDMPEDIHVTLWGRVTALVAAGKFAVTTELYDELLHLQGNVGQCIKDCKAALNHEVGQGQWDWRAYLAHVERMKDDHRAFISEYNGGRKSTVGLIDISGVAMAKTMRLPLISMEKLIVQAESKNRRIPNICDTERVPHLTFSDFLRREGIRI